MVGPAAGRFDAFGVVQQLGFVGDGGTSRCVERIGNCLGLCGERGLVAPIPVQMRGPDGFGAVQKRLLSRTLSQDEPRPCCFEIRLQRLQALVQPPPMRPARLPRRFAVGIPHKDGHNGPLLGSGVESRIVAQAQVVAQPDEGDVGHSKYVLGV